MKTLKTESIYFSQVITSDKRLEQEKAMMNYGKSSFYELYKKPSYAKIQANKDCLSSLYDYCKEIGTSLEKLSYCGQCMTFSIRALLSNNTIVIFTAQNTKLIQGK